MEDHHRLLREIGATDAKHLRAMHPGQRVLVAGVRASTQTPPIASGKRIIFVTLEDGSGLVDLAFFEDSHERCAHTVFHHGLLLIRGTVEARGPRRTVVGEMAWDLDELATDQHHRTVLRLLQELGARLRTSGEITQALTLTVTYADRTQTPRSRTHTAPTAHTPARELRYGPGITRAASALGDPGRAGLRRGGPGRRPGRPGSATGIPRRRPRHRKPAGGGAGP